MFEKNNICTFYMRFYGNQGKNNNSIVNYLEIYKNQNQ